MPDLRPYSMQWEKFTTPQSLTDGAVSTVTTWEAAPTFGAAFLTRGFNPTTGIYTIPARGTYQLLLVGTFAANATGRRGIGTGFSGILSDVPAVAGGLAQRVTEAILIDTDNAGVTVGLGLAGMQALQNSGGPLNLTFAMIQIVYWPETIHELPTI